MGGQIFWKKEKFAALSENLGPLSFFLFWTALALLKSLKKKNPTKAVVVKSM